MTLLIVGIILFLGIHLIRVVAPGFRTAMIERFGAGGWKAGYSIASIASLVVLIYGFGLARQATGILYTPPAGLAHLALLLMVLSMICLVAGVLPAGHIAEKTKHPMVLSIKIWALAHLLANGETASVLLFASFLAWGVILRISLKRRERAGEIVRRPFVSARYDILSVVIGIVLYAAFLLRLHEWLIGVSPLPM
ncbi:NnrU family protein [Rhizobiaceae bacterium n13]|uniref:NnrU family protein n=1 Tax=Ferirhizobium litorale TaxID=2927786 RepID=A0AAE3TZG2_9HYPH|nr:NnrU family protein [Fererhizobium litorale]MDI7860801.1 NnrU family protein [Fererhizobium litorale]MDI7920949.1 NnrU family protein [Fererhizobium litorale]